MTDEKTTAPEKGFATLVEGDIGTGKTHALREIVEKTDLTLFVLSCEPGIESVLGDLPKDRCHWHYVAPAKASWETMIKNAKLVNTMTNDALQKMPNLNSKDYTQFIEVLSTLANFVCDRTGESFGCVDEWGTDRVLAIDTLSGLSTMAMDLCVGAKPIKTQPDWGVAMDNLQRLNDKLCADVKCHYILNAHVEREKDEVTGGVQLMVSTLGQKLAPKIPRYFDNVVYADNKGGEYSWSTQSNASRVKSRHLPLGVGLAPSHASVFDAWKKQGGVIVPTKA